MSELAQVVGSCGKVGMLGIHEVSTSSSMYVIIMNGTLLNLYKSVLNYYII